jgi:hypothetical protein
MDERPHHHVLGPLALQRRLENFVHQEGYLPLGSLESYHSTDSTMSIFQVGILRDLHPVYTVLHDIGKFTLYQSIDVLLRTSRAVEFATLSPLRGVAIHRRKTTFCGSAQQKQKTKVRHQPHKPHITGPFPRWVARATLARRITCSPHGCRLSQLPAKPINVAQSQQRVRGRSLFLLVRLERPQQ